MNITKDQEGSNVILEGQPPLRGESITRQSVAPEQARGHKGWARGYKGEKARW